MTRSFRRPALAVAAALLALFCSTGCPDGGDETVGLIPSTGGTGPKIVFDPLEDPAPEIPFPNDLVTVPDPASPTGRRVNISPFAPSRFEEEIRSRMNELDGFGTFAPLSVRFDAPIDLTTVSNGAIKLVDITPGSRTYGRAIPLDIDRWDRVSERVLNGSYPVTLNEAWDFPPHSRYGHAWNLLFDPYFEDTGSDGVENNAEPGYDPERNMDPSGDNYDAVSNPGGTEGNGRLDAGEPDFDADGVADRGNRVDWNLNGVLDCGEDLNCNQRWDPDEPDTDGDGLFDACEFVDTYEVETDTLIMRPLVPLEQVTEYAVVLTRRMTGLGPDGAFGGDDGEPVRSPFAWAHHVAQSGAIAPALPLLKDLGIEADDIAFIWTFTTQSVTAGLETIRRGLDGEGFLGDLPESHPQVIERIVDLDLDIDGSPLFNVGNIHGDHAYILQGDFLDLVMKLVLPLIPRYDFTDFNLNDIDFILFGRYVTPNFRATDDEVFEIDPVAGRATVGVEEVPFLIAVPKANKEKGYEPPFPVCFYAHGNESFHFEGVMAAEAFAYHGIAVAGIDAVGHGPAVTPDVIIEYFEDANLSLQLQILLLRTLGTLFKADIPPGQHTRDELIDYLLTVGVLKELGVEGRGTDVDGDGYKDSGENFFTANTFKTRDVVRQTIVDYMHFLRILKNLDQEKIDELEAIEKPDEASPEELEPHLLAGDFNADGVLDVGGTVNADGDPQDYYMAGTSLGGITTSILMGVEPGITTGTPVVPGGGFTDIIGRSDLKNVMLRVYYQVHGPLVIGEEFPDEPGLFQVRLESKYHEEILGVIAAPPEDGSMVVLNEANDETEKAVLREYGTEGTILRGFSVGIAGDPGDILRIRSLDADGKVIDEIYGVSMEQGFGIERNTPDFRRFIGLSQIMLEPGDPINYAPHWFLNPLPGVPPKRILELVAPGDFTVPLFTGISLARAGGLFGSEKNECDGSPADMSSCLPDLEAGDFEAFRECLQADCDLINMRLREKGSMLGYDAPPRQPRFDVDNLSMTEFPFTCTGCGIFPGEEKVRTDAECDPIEGTDEYACMRAHLGPLPEIASDGTGGRSAVRFMFTGAHSFLISPSTEGYLGAEQLTWHSQGQVALYHEEGGTDIVDCTRDEIMSGDCLTMDHAGGGGICFINVSIGFHPKTSQASSANNFTVTKRSLTPCP